MLHTDTHTHRQANRESGESAGEKQHWNEAGKRGREETDILHQAHPRIWVAGTKSRSQVINRPRHAIRSNLFPFALSSEMFDAAEGHGPFFKFPSRLVRLIEESFGTADLSDVITRFVIKRSTFLLAHASGGSRSSVITHSSSKKFGRNRLSIII